MGIDRVLLLILIVKWIQEYFSSKSDQLFHFLFMRCLSLLDGIFSGGKIRISCIDIIGNQFSPIRKYGSI